jgi:hypothetical protein
MRPEGASSDAKGENIACPATDTEVAAFIEILKKTSHLTAADEEAIRKRFRKNEE